MPLIDLEESFTLDYYYDKNLLSKLNSPDEAALSYKVEIAKYLSSAIYDLHQHGHLFIDFKPQNIRIFKKTHAVTLIDCDGYTIKSASGEIFPAELLSTDYISPEAYRGQKHASDLDEYQDRYALAVIIFQLLNRGIHPFQGIVTSNVNASTNDEKAAEGLYPHGLTSNYRIKPRPQSIHHLIDVNTRKLFDKAFTAVIPSFRPSAQDWTNHFGSLLDGRNLSRCQQFPTNIQHMRFKDLPCPACYLNNLAGFVPTKTEIKAQIPSSRVNTVVPPPAPKNQDFLDKNMWWIISGLILAVLIWIGNSTKTPPPVQTTYQPQQVPATTVPVVTNKFISLYVSSNSRAAGYSLGNETQSQADMNAFNRCNEQIEDKQADKCIRVSSGIGQCLSISRASNGAVGSQIGEDIYKTKADAQNLCVSSGGKDCPFPQDTTICQN